MTLATIKILDMIGKVVAVLLVILMAAVMVKALIEGGADDDQ